MEKIKTIGIQEVKYVSSTDYDKTQKFIPEIHIKKPDTLYFFFTIATAFLLIFTSTTALVWTSPAIVKLKSNDTNINPLGRPITTVEISRLLGIPMMVAIVGTCFLPKVADYIGRKRSLQIIGYGLFISIILLAFSTTINLMILFFSMFITLHFLVRSLLPLYVTEICEDHNRAKYGCLIYVFASLGILYTYVLGPAFSLRNFTMAIAGPLTFFLIFFFFTPETPVYLLQRGREEECMKALRKLRSNKTEEELEIDLINIRRTISVKKEQPTSFLMTLLKIKEVKIGTILATLTLSVRILSGALVVMSLLAPILNEAGTNFSGNSIAIIAGVVSVLTSIFSSLVVEKIGIKLLLLISTLGVGITISALGLYFFLKQINCTMISQLQWLPIVCVSAYIIFFAGGLGPLPTSIIGELFSIEVRSACLGIATTVSIILNCLVSFSFPIVAEAFGTHWCLWFFGIFSLVGAVIMHKLLPDTEGKTILEIQEMLKTY